MGQDIYIGDYSVSSTVLSQAELWEKKSVDKLELV